MEFNALDFKKVDLLKEAFGKHDYSKQGSLDEDLIKGHPLVEGLWCVGKYFVLVGNTEDWKVERVGGDCETLTGYTADEIYELGTQFMVRFALPEGLPFNMSVIKLAMEYILERPHNERKWVHVTYFYRCGRKDGSPVTIQHQSIPIAFDDNEVPYIFVNVFTDVSFLAPAELPQAILCNRKTNETFHIRPERPELIKTKDLFSLREKEIIRLLISGLNSKQIAAELFISQETVRTHRKNILRKANMSTTSGLVAYAIINGL
ncbi:hypothetical protein J8L85_11205 [Maribacter sp. MMG018]|uniref:helix-turn-helix transcriptional regulator n=1 Tax=Maribacter sp. MMG018 TaxID=2822688 RepID=UPI001B378B23|nr:LuxR family transcriptional regulator [Maribacter sp. MMG018]MBQ4915008.1 hypothetical protein [Maribacter sp. MMG018]